MLVAVHCMAMTLAGTASHGDDPGSSGALLLVQHQHAAACAALACCCLCSTGMLLLVQHRNAPEHLCSTGLLVSLTWCILSARSTGMLLVMQPEHWHAAACAAQACAACFLCSTGRCKTPHWQVSAVPYSPAACTSSQYKGAALVLRLQDAGALLLNVSQRHIQPADVRALCCHGGFMPPALRRSF